ncbi:MAG TPA: penicillin-binding protein, partial [Agrobacterium sp.]|nr:penicillin-binding protein [Agrobacterium sp.]
DNREQVLDPMTAYQTTSMLEGVVQRGTAAGKIKVDLPVAGKTGTTNDEKDAWFVGYTPDMVAGLYIGFDSPAPLGRGGTGGSLSAPIFGEFIADAAKHLEPSKFIVPEGMKFIAVNRKTGMAASEGEPDTIMEAFKPGTGPADTFSVIGAEGMSQEDILKTSPQAQQAITSGGGGLY